VYDERPADSTLLIPSVEQHIEQFGRTPELVAADPGFFSAANEAKAEEMGVKRVSIPSHATKSAARKQRQKQRWFKKAQKWRTGCEGRISVLKRHHGLQRCRYKGPKGMQRWVGFGVIADMSSTSDLTWRHNPPGGSNYRQRLPHITIPRSRRLLHILLVPAILFRRLRPDDAF
jgi:hypothetical protein